jgi:hydroxymethylpyrimidine pyrophosphatase-like HAD family hydrolase
VQIVIASGRHHRNIAALAGIGEPGWILSSQGAVVRNEQTGATLLELPMQSGRIKGICERARAGGMTVIAYHRDRAHIERTSPWTDFYARQTGWLPQQSDFRELAPDGFQKIIWSGQARRIDAVAPALAKEYAGKYQIVVTGQEFREFLAPGATKVALSA